MIGRHELRSAAATFLAIAAPLLVMTASAAGQLPGRPEDIKFPDLKYDPPRAADYRVTLKNGMVAYLVPDRSLPLVTVHVLMRLGPDLDPSGKDGLGEIMVAQLTRGGAGGMTAEQLEDRVAALGATLDAQMGGGGRGMMGMGGVPIGPAESRVSLNLLAKDLDAGLDLLTACLKTPAFQEDRLQLAKEQAIQQMKERNDDTGGIERREWSLLMRGPDHWSNRWTTQASVAGLSRDDLIAQHRRFVGVKNFLIAAAGDFERAALVKALEKAFAGWPQPGERPGPPAAPAAPPAPGWYVVDKDVNQARVSFGLPALDRYDPDFHAALVMNDILGGGGFTSRLVNRIRSDEGLAYSVSSRFEGGVYYPEPWRVAFQTKVRSTAFAIQLAMTEIERMRGELVDEAALQNSKNKFIESLPAGFETAGAIAGALAAEELTGRYQRDPQYFAKYRERIRAVTAADVQRVARRLLDPAHFAFLVVGKVDDVLLGDPKHDVTFTGLAGGEPTRLPLRDPLTMQPMRP